MFSNVSTANQKRKYKMTTNNRSQLCNKFASYFKCFSWIFWLVELKLKFINFLSPLTNLGIRFWMANIFWQSGILKLPSGFLGIGKGNWGSTLYLFEYEHPVPGFSPEMAAYLGTSFEILCSILLIFGFGTRVGATILLLMSAFIEITYQHHITHIYWMILLSVLIFQGPGKISLDYIIRKKTLSCDKYKEMAKLED